jgi:hypothetical protein
MTEKDIHPDTTALMLSEFIKMMHPEKFKRLTFGVRLFGRDTTYKYYLIFAVLRYVRVGMRAEKERKLKVPPRGLWLRIALPPELAEEIIANFAHHYETVWIKEHPVRVARMIYAAQICRALLAHYSEALMEILGMWLAKRG